MADVFLTVSQQGSHTREGLIVGNPQAAAAIDAGDIPSGTWSVTPELAVEACSKNRLMTVVSNIEIEILQIAENQTTANPTGVPTPIPVPTSGDTAYACLLHPSTVGIYVRTP